MMGWWDVQIERIRIMCEGICYEGMTGCWQSFFIECDREIRVCELVLYGVKRVGVGDGGGGC